MGRRKKATVLKLAGGTFKTSQNAVNEPTYKVVEDLSVPKTIDEQGPAARKWRELAKHLSDKGLLTDVDKQNLEAYCMAYETMLKAYEEIQNEGISKVSPTGISNAHPAVQVFNGATKVMTSYSAMLGLDPASRTKIEGRPSGAKAKKFSDLQK